MQSTRLYNHVSCTAKVELWTFSIYIKLVFKLYHWKFLKAVSTNSIKSLPNSFSVYVSLLYDLELTFFQLIHINTVNCDCNEFCELVLVKLFKNFKTPFLCKVVVISDFDIYWSYLLVIA